MAQQTVEPTPEPWWVAPGMTALGVFLTAIGVIASLVVDKLPHWAFGLVLVVYVCALFFVSMWYARSSEVKDDAAYSKIEAWRAEQTLEIERERMRWAERTGSYLIQQKAMEEIRDCTEEALEVFRDAATEVQALLGRLRDPLATEEVKSAAAQQREKIEKGGEELLSHILKGICESFEADPRCRDETAFGHNWFKATFFIPSRDEHGDLVLVRKASFYPRGLQPKTDEIKKSEHPHACAIQAFEGERMVILESVKEEAQQPSHAKRWEDLREDQYLEYESMLTVHVAMGERGTTEREVLGVVTVDTNRKRYFKEEQEFRAFAAAFLSPFKGLISLFYAWVHCQEESLGLLEDHIEETKPA